jgi:hypothetical protein
MKVTFYKNLPNFLHNSVIFEILGTKKCLSLLIIPYLLPAPRTRKDKITGKSIPGFTKFEVQESFAEYFEVINHKMHFRNTNSSFIP